MNQKAHRRIRATVSPILLVAGALFSGCIGTEVPQKSPELEEAQPEAKIAFKEIAKQSGLAFIHNDGSFGSKWLPETMGSGCAWVDYDNDGDPDALLLSGMDWKGHETNRRQGPALFRNDSGAFVEVTQDVGLGGAMYAMGVAIGDYDNDGDSDLYVTALGSNRLYRNESGIFRDVAPELGVDDAGFGSSATWFDLDNDGDLDLLTLNYVQWSPETDLFCSLDGTNKSYCTPESYPGDSPRLYRNDGAGFTDLTLSAGLEDKTGKGLGVVAFDYDQDGWQDLFLANDTQPNALYRNQANGTFKEEGVMAGVAFDENGRARGAMGVDVADYDRSGKPSLAIGNFSNEMIALYHNEGSGFFIDEAPTSAIGRQSMLTLAFGMIFLDADLDGQLDLFVANGHVEPDIQAVQPEVSYAQRAHLFRNLGNRRYVDIAGEAGDLAQPMVARGTAVADYDGDGDLDLLVNSVADHVRLFRNDSKVGNSIQLKLIGGSGSGLDAYGAEVIVKTSESARAFWLQASRSYCSQSDSVMTIGIGENTTAEVSIVWPSGRESQLGSLGIDGVHEIREPSPETP